MVEEKEYEEIQFYSRIGKVPESDLLMRIPKAPNDNGWFEVKFASGKKYTVVSLECLIESYIQRFGEDGYTDVVNEGWEEE